MTGDGDLAEHDIQRLLIREARLLDERRYRDWLELFTDDVHYWMPANETRRLRDLPVDMTPRMAFFDDGRRELELRIRRFEADTAWAEDPPTRHIHLVANVELLGTGPDGARVASVVIAFRSRGDTELAPIVARRTDRVVSDGGRLQIAERRIDALSTTLHARNINTFL